MFRKTLLFTFFMMMLSGGASAITAETTHDEKQTETTTADEEIKLIAVRMYADWCGYCKTLDAKLEDIKPEFEGSGTLFTYFDLTDEYQHSQTRLMAERMNLSHIYETYGERTGFMVLVDPETGEVLQEISSEPEPDAIRAALRAAL